MMKRFLFLVFLVMMLPAAAQAATLTLGGPSTAKVGDVITVPVLLSTAQSANAVSSTVTYPTDLLTLVSVSKAGSIITLWPTDPTTANATVEFGGIILNPGWSGTRGTVVTMTFTAKAVGAATIEFESDASVLANDGNATPILSGTSPSTITISPGATAAPVKTPAKPQPATSEPVTTTPAPVVNEPQPQIEPEPVLPPPAAPSFMSMLMQSLVYPHVLELILLLLLIFLAWHRYERGVPPFYFTFEGKAPMTPPKPEILLKQFDTLREAIKLEALSIQKVKEGQPLSPEEERFLTLFKKLMTMVEGSN